MGSRRHLARRSVGHLWHFIKWRSWPAMERKKDRSGGRGREGEVEKVEGNAARRKVDSLRGGPRNPAPSSVAVAPLRVRAGREALVCVPARRGGHLTSVEAEMRSMRRGTHCNHCAWYARAFRTKRQRKMRSVDAPCSLTSPATAWEATILHDRSNSSKASELTVAECCT